MNVDELLTKNKQLEEEVNMLKEKLKKYTAPSRSKNYYENHKEEILILHIFLIFCLIKWAF
jgi:cell division septum initiation protein DivIVA